MLENIRKIKTELLEGVENLVQEKNIGYLEAALLYCDTNGISTEQAAAIIQTNKHITSKIEYEATALNFLKKIG